jgi:hypothetical protein
VDHLEDFLKPEAWLLLDGGGHDLQLGNRRKEGEKETARPEDLGRMGDRSPSLG